MANRRIKKKGECAHFVDGPRFLVTDDPYPIYNHELYCSCGYFNWTWGNHDCENLPCEKCKGFRLSRKKIRKEREKVKENMEYIRYMKKVTLQDLVELQKNEKELKEFNIYLPF